VIVEDNGTPIPTEFREKIFDKFYRVKNDIIHNQKGFGLGLYIAKEYTNAIGGRLEYLNVIKGNCFSLTLPKK
jgi:two-component system phosphate regulon sensor histidine kinase PhoR